MHYIDILTGNFNLRKSKYDDYVSEIIRKNGPTLLNSRVCKVLPAVKPGPVSKKKEDTDDYKRNLSKLEKGVYQRLKTLYRFSFATDDKKLLVNSILQNPTIYEIAFALAGPRKYFSHGTALYFLGLSNQKSIEVVMSEFVKGRTSLHSGRYDPEVVKLIFSKDQRTKGQELSYPQGKVRLLSRVDKDHRYLGQISPFNTAFKVFLSSLELTLVDSVVLPEFSGGVLALVAAFKHADINLEKLKRCYDDHHFFYPYWQNIGFYLELSGKNVLANEWKDLFINVPKLEFFLLKGFRSNWVFNSNWMIWAPPI